MEYYIYQRYRNESRHNLNKEQGIDRFSPKAKKGVISCLIIVIIAVIGMEVTLIRGSANIWVCGWTIVLVVAALIILFIETKNQKEHMDRYVNPHKEKIEVLEKVLGEFNVKSKEKILELIGIYQDCIDKEKEKEKRRNGIIVVLFSALEVVLTISFPNMKMIGMDFSIWLYFALLLFCTVATAGILIYVYTLLGTLKQDYEMMIRELKELLLLKY